MCEIIVGIPGELDDKWLAFLDLKVSCNTVLSGFGSFVLVFSCSVTILQDLNFEFVKLEDCRKAVMAFYLGDHHPIGTVAMGDALDARLRVKGVQRLRIADASVFPGNISGNIMSTVYMVGEKAADLIKEDWNSTVQGETP